MEGAAAAPRCGLLLTVLVAAATLLPGAKGERRADGLGARGPGPASGSLLLFLKHGAGPGAQVAAPGRPGFPDPAGATRAGAGRRGGAGEVAASRAEAGPRGLQGAAAGGPAEVGGYPRRREASRTVSPASLSPRGLGFWGVGGYRSAPGLGAWRASSGSRGAWWAETPGGPRCRGRPPRATHLPPGLCVLSGREDVLSSVLLGRVGSPAIRRPGIVLLVET